MWIWGAIAQWWIPLNIVLRACIAGLVCRHEPSQTVGQEPPFIILDPPLIAYIQVGLPTDILRELSRCAEVEIWRVVLGVVVLFGFPLL